VIVIGTALMATKRSIGRPIKREPGARAAAARLEYMLARVCDMV